jgi:uncharacterized protein YndB with AHSA1/START domain
MHLLAAATYQASPASLFQAIASGQVWQLTGAQDIAFEFREGGLFKLGFGARGVISGAFLQIVPAESVVLTWHVAGFERPDEASEVMFTVSSAAHGAQLEIEHRNIASRDSLRAKSFAWDAILQQLTDILTQ